MSPPSPAQGEGPRQDQSPVKYWIGIAARDHVLRGVDGAISVLPATSRKEVTDLLGLVAMAPTRLLLGGRWGSWETATRAETTAYLEGLRTSSIALKRTAYAALRDLPVTAFYGDRRNWKLAGYDGPLVDNAA